MNSIVRTSILALSLLIFSAPHLISARAGGPTVGGSLRFSIEDGLSKYVEFNASSDGEGKTTGKMTFNGPMEIPDQNVDGEERAGFSGSLSDLYVEAEFDGLLVEDNRAVMSGTITGSNLSDYIGQRVLLVVEDNGTGAESEGDKLTWGIYKPATGGWIPTDAELKEDDGALLKWVATDAEREDDKGIPSGKNIDITCQSFPLSSFSFDEFRDADGDIQVRQ
jgi:hypothetical protein